MALPHIQLNGREYAGTAEPVVVVCVDGSEPAYHEKAIEAGVMPFFEKLLASGNSLSATCAMPSFTNPNNLSIATGVPPAVHGIGGNYFFDRDSGEEVMMNDPKWLRVRTLFAEYSAQGAKVAVITAKDKLRRLLGSGLDGGICFSAEFASKATVAEHGISGVLDMLGMEQPSVYSAELSELVMAGGVALLRDRRPDLMYLSLTDYVQHKHAPGSATANAFYAMLDAYCEKLDNLGCVLVVTADHGMNAKSAADGEPRVVYLQGLLDEWLGAGHARVVLPITDPYTVHHGALGSFATIYLDEPAEAGGLLARLSRQPGVELALDIDTAAARFELPADRMGDLVVIGDQGTALGTTPDRHDLSALKEPLRSHGGLSEQNVPFVVNRDVRALPAGHRLRNFDAYWVATTFAETP
ncbi:phosphonoacetate hydrolase [Amycolatopsis sp. NPDC102389]|uniref:phosphonoacetate hydrolase n=1 Tax=Amycolatopsis sp. NPDC102389 TaxID=3363941 RepID=UPI00380A6A68